MWIQISSGQGPDECCLAVKKFDNYITHQCMKSNISVYCLSSTAGRLPDTYRSVLLNMNVVGSKENLGLNLDGTMLWICQSPYRPKHKRKNWFFNCEIYNEPDTNELDMSLIRIETMCSHGKGGQNVNKVESAVRIIHIPTGFSVTAREERSQLLNKKLALARLKHHLEKQIKEQEMLAKAALWKQHNHLVRGNPVQVFIGEDFKLKQ